MSNHDPYSDCTEVHRTLQVYPVGQALSHRSLSGMPELGFPGKAFVAFYKSRFSAIQIPKVEVSHAGLSERATPSSHS